MTSLFRRSWGTLIALGVLAVVFGLVASIWPIETTAVLVTLWGVYALVDGVMALMLAFSEAGRSARGWLIFVGAIGVVAGLLAIFRPFSSAAALAWILGIWLITRGVLESDLGLRRSGEHLPLARRSQRTALLVAGGILVARPGAAALAVSVWLGILAIAWGILLLGGGFALRRSIKDLEQQGSPTA